MGLFENMAARSCVIFLAMALYYYGVEALQQEQIEGLLKLREVLETPSVTSSWNESTEYCNLPPCTPRLCIICSAPETLTYLRIVGDGKKKLSATFSATELVDTLLAFPELRGLELTNLGMWGMFPSNLAQMSNLQVVNFTGNFFTGEIPKTLKNLTGLRVLAMDNNAISGSLPYFLTTLDTLSLSNNYVTETLNDSVASFTSLRFLYLSNNSVSGAIPTAIASLPNLQVLSLAHNRLTGVIPSMLPLKNLKVLNLGGNSLGPGFPAVGAQLVSLHIGNNRVAGAVPEFLESLVELQVLEVSGNAMTGTPPPFLFSALPKLASLNLARNRFSGVLRPNLTLSKSLAWLDVSGNFFTGPPPAQFLRAGVHFQGNCMDTTKQKQGSVEYCTKGNGNKEAHHRHLMLVIILVATAGGVCVSVAVCALVFLLVRRCGNEKDSVAAPEDHGNFGSFRGIPSELLSNARYLSQSMRLGVLPQAQNRVFALEELKVATNNFSPGSLIGEGRHGKVFKGLLDDKTVVAIKWLNFKAKEDMNEYRTQLEVLSKLRHRHLVSVLGYCSEEVISVVEDEEFKSFRLFIVSDFMAHGDLRSHLSKNVGKEPMVWSQRLAAVIAAGRGVHYLHTGVVPPIFYNNLKITSILLDSNMVAQVTDFGLPIRRVSFSMDVVAAKAKPAGPRLVHEGSLRRRDHRDKQDVYDYGAILLEIVLGRPPTIRNPFPQNRSELERLTKEKGPSMELIDRDIVGTCGAESLATVLEIAGKCMVDDPTRRPSMEDVLWNLQYALQVHSSVNDAVNDEYDLRRDEFQKAPSFNERKNRGFYDNRVADEDWKADPLTDSRDFLR
uniref:Leucine-rich repeat receptor-like protein kinase n=1 Tax=Pohlia nutans TaxID=140635 RepID=A0A1P8DYZ4_9BRYO|nr:leucine-rich repeat receptor-like protein kinase [Pohlia nutans]